MGIKMFVSVLPALVVSAVVAKAQAAVQTEAGIVSLKQWTARNSVAVRHFMTSKSSQMWTPYEDLEPYVRSRSGDLVAYTTYSGDLDCDCNVYELLVFSVASIRAALAPVNWGDEVAVAPIRTVTMRSSRSLPAISGVEFEDDGQSVRFVGMDTAGSRQIYRLNISSGVLEKLTNSLYGVQTYRIHGDSIVYNAHVPKDTSQPKYKYPYHIVDLRDLSDSYFDNAGSDTTYTTFVAYKNRVAWQLDSGYVVFGEASISPDGKRAVIVRAPKEVPASWSGYDGESLDGSGKRKDLLPQEFPQFIMIDFERGVSVPFIDAPTGVGTKVGMGHKARSLGVGDAELQPTALWLADNRFVILVNTALPLSGLPERQRMSYIAAYEVATGRLQVIEPLVSPESSSTGSPARRVRSVELLVGGRDFAVHHEISGRPADSMRYSLRGSTWTGRVYHAQAPKRLDGKNNRTPLAGGITLTLRQSANSAPRMVGSDGKHEVSLTPPDPALRGVSLSEMRSFEWFEADGKKSTGGLILPGNVLPAKPVATVIQPYHYLPRHFRPDGPYPSGYAAQLLAAKGIAILNIDTFGSSEGGGTERELAKFIDRIDASTRTLVSKGISDPDKIGLIGFSRGGYLTYYAITHPGRTRIAAAIVDDSWTGTYYSYLMSGATRAPSSPSFYDFEHLYGGTFWQNRDSWLREENSFNVDKVQAPTLFAVHGEFNILSLLDAVGAFSINRKPFEAVLFPSGEHQLVRPRERAASLELSTDWMGFWLLDSEDSNPDKAAQYARWRSLRKGAGK